MYMTLTHFDVCRKGDTLLKKLIDAIPHAILHHQAFHVFTEGLRKDYLSELQTWEKMVLDWESGTSNVDPYLVEEDSISVNEIRRQLAEEDHQNVEHGAAPMGITSTTFILSGLSIEDTQYIGTCIYNSKECLHMVCRLSLQNEARLAKTDAQKATLQTKRTSLLQKIQKYREAHLVFMPGLVAEGGESTHQPELIDIQLPSSLSATQRISNCIPGLPKVEECLREAHAVEALSTLRRQLRTRVFAKKFKDQNASSQGAYTRLRALHDQIEKRICSARDSYNAARAALLKLRGPGDWELVYRVLLATDIRSLNERTVRGEDEEAYQSAQMLVDSELGPSSQATLPTILTTRLQTGQGHHTVSWIWINLTQQELDNDNDGSLHTGIRLEWVKARARAERWREEVMLIDEEMRRTLEFTSWKARWWIEQVKSRITDSETLNEGLRAYAAEQADVEQRRRVAWEIKWAAVRIRAREALREKLETVAAEFAPYAMIEVELDSDEEENQEPDDEE
ncbi:hypothetical protein DXG01_009990 [Tephrocybe rancida]|nr:hypothetical protein DXG01_009990 [Tephrocybe rancida]